MPEPDIYEYKNWKAARRAYDDKRKESDLCRSEFDQWLIGKISSKDANLAEFLRLLPLCSKEALLYLSLGGQRNGYCTFSLYIGSALLNTFKVRVSAAEFDKRFNKLKSFDDELSGLLERATYLHDVYNRSTVTIPVAQSTEDR